MREYWLKLHRKILDNPIVTKDGDHLAIWIWLLCEAAYKPHDIYFGTKRITLQPGQLITGRDQIAKELKIHPSKIQRVLKLFETEHQIEQQTSRQGRLISIVNWTDYQDCEQQNEQQVNNKRTTSEQQVNATEERKERKKERNIFYPPTVEEVRAYCLERGNGIDPEVFWNFYESKNWMVGKNKMKKWKSAIITWEKNHPEQKAPPPPKKTQEEIDRELMILEEIRAQESEQRRMEREARHGKNS